MKKILSIIVLFVVLLSACKKNTGDLTAPASSTNNVAANTHATAAPLAAKFRFHVADPNNIFENQAIQFENESTGAASCVWEFGNNTKTQQTNPEMSYPWHGFYTVKLTVFDAQGNRNSITKDISILCLYAGGNHPPATTGR